LYSLIEKMENPVTGQKLAPHISVKLADPRNPRSHSTVTSIDATFAAPKSFSLYWILADEPTRNELDHIWNKALEEAIHQLEEKGCYGRVGHGGTANVKLTGFAIAAYDHYTNRNGEPHYHTHAVISNIALREDGKAVALDGQTLLAVKESINVYHSQILRDMLRRDMGIEWEQRHSIINPKTKVWEMKQIPDELIRATSSRSFAIEQKLNRLTQEFIAANGREPTRRELSRLEKKAWATTRRHKTEDTMDLGTSRAHVERVATNLGLDTQELVMSVRATSQSVSVTFDQLDKNHIFAIAKKALIDTMADEITVNISAEKMTDEQFLELFEQYAGAHKTTFTYEHMYTSALSLLDNVPFASETDREQTAQFITQQTAQQFTPITSKRYSIPAELLHDTRYTHINDMGEVTSVLDRKKGTRIFATNSLVQAENNLTTLMDSKLATAFIDKNIAARLLDEYNTHAIHPLSSDQYAAALRALSTEQRIFSIIGAAGTGKTTTLKAMKYVIDHVYGDGYLIGAAPSTRAAEEMQESLQVNCATIAAIITEAEHHAVENRIIRAQQILSSSSSSVEEKKSARAILISSMSMLKQYTIPSNGIMIVDEAGMASTRDLDKLCQIAADKNTRILFTGDHMQLAAVGEGSGALYETYLKGSTHYAQLNTLFRFQDNHEADVTLMLRDQQLTKQGTYQAINEYRAMGRIHQSRIDGAMADQAYQDTLKDVAEGLDAILMTNDNETMSMLNERFTRDLMSQGKVETDSSKRVKFFDNVYYGVGDHIVTRKNTGADIITSKGERVHNGDHWTITRIDFENKLVHVSNPQEEETAALPFWYVAQYAHGGYASTIYLAQGSTYDKARVFISQDTVMDHASLYVAQTRGKISNEIYVDLPEVNGQDMIQWKNAKARDYIHQGKKLYTLSDQNPDSSKWYTDKDLLPTEQELADKRLNEICATQVTVFASRQKDQYDKRTHSINTLVSEYQYLQSILVSEDMVHILRDHHDDHYVTTLTSSSNWLQLVDAYEKAYMVYPELANQILITRVRGEADIHENNDNVLFDTYAPLDAANVLTRRLNEISALYRGTSVFGPTGHLTAYTPQYTSEKTSAQVAMVRQAEHMLNSALDNAVAQSVKHPLPWQKTLTGVKKSHSTVSTRYCDLMKAVLVYRAANEVTSMFSPFGPRVDYRVNPGRSGWRNNLSNRMYNYKHPDKTPRFVPDHIIDTNSLLSTPDTSVDEQETIFNVKEYAKITSINEKVFKHWKQDYSSQSIQWAKEHQIPSRLIAYTGHHGDLLEWATHNWITPEDLAQAGLVKQIDGRWVENYANATVTPIQDAQGHIVAFMGSPITQKEEITLADSLPVSSGAFSLDSNSVWGINRATKATLEKTQNHVLIGQTPYQSAHILDTLGRGHQAVAISPINNSLTSKHLDQIRNLASDMISYTFITTGSESDRQFLSHAFSQLTRREREHATVLNQQNVSERKTIEQLSQETKPLWQAITDVTIDNLLTRESATHVYMQLSQDITDKMPPAKVKETDDYIRQAITLQLEAQQHEQADAIQQAQVQAAQQNQQAQASI
ncbi:conjugative relaxase domain protein, partial [Gardnerella vaginalis JCP8481A]